MPTIAQRVAAHLAVGGRPAPPTRGEGLLLHGAGRAYVRLLTNAGQRTAAGLAYEAQTGAQLPAGGYDGTQQPRRQGDVESIRTRRGTDRVVRRWDPASMQWVYTALGRQFYSQRRSEYVVQIPVTKRGRRDNGSHYVVAGWMPITDMGLANIRLPQNLTEQQRDERIKALVGVYLQPDQVVYEVSEETWRYDAAGTWIISEMVTQPAEGAGQPRTEVLTRRLGTAPARLSQLPHPDGIVSEAFEAHDDRLCVPRQMAAVLRQDLDEVLRGLNDVVGNCEWQEEGATAEMVVAYAKARGLGWCVLHNGTALESGRGWPALVFAVHEAHAYFYHGRSARTLMKRAPAGSVAERLNREPATGGVEAGLWEPWEAGALTAGHFWVEEGELDAVRGWFLAEGRHPKVILKSEHQARSLEYTLSADEGRGVVVVHGLPAEAREIQAWLGRLELNLAYRGEGLPNISQKVLLALLKEGRERVYLTGEEKAQLLEAHDNRCALCGVQWAEFEWDHIAPLAQSLGAQRFQPLCRSCHRDKTLAEPAALETDILASHFELGVWEGYVESERPPPLVYRHKSAEEGEGGLMVADVVRCRKRALEFSAHELPVFCPFDDIQPVADCALGDLNFVTKRASNFITQLGYTGPGWQHRVQTEWLLHTCVISWGDVTHRITATGRYPADALRRPLERMEAAWGEAGLGKRSINALIGLWCLDEQWSYKLTTAEFEADRPPGAHLRRTFHHPGGAVTDWISARRLITAASHRPLHDLCMCTEAVRVGQMIYCLRKQGAVLCEFKTDSVLFKPLKRAKALLSELEIRDLGGLRERFEPGGLRFERRCEMAVANDVGERAFRVGPARDEDLLKHAPPAPCRRDPAFALPPTPWRQLTPEAARDRVLNGESLLCLGVAGTGKTHYMAELAQLLRLRGVKVEAVSKTHVASSRAGGVTADHWVRRHVLHGACACDVLWVDEISQLDVGLLAQLNKLTRTGLRFLLSGDWNQFPPIANSWRGCEVSDGAFERSTLLWRLAGGNRTELTQCRRADAALFELYCSLARGGSREHAPLDECVAAARATVGFRGPARHNLVISHAKRVAVNRELNARERPAGAVWVSVKHEPAHHNTAQSMWLWPGMRMLGCTASMRSGLRNGVLYTLEAVSPEWVTLAGGVALPMEAVKRCLRLAWAQTYASCQGTEFDGTLRLHDIESPRFSRTHLFVGLSRAKGADRVDLRP
jgi:hypothetical protein